MTPAEAAVLLARISASDNREVSEAAARAWAESLPDVALADALEYLPRFFRTATRDTKNWVYPGDVLDGVRTLFAERRKAHVEAARRTALETVDANDEEVLMRGGVEIYGVRAARDAGAQWDREHSAPGAEIDAKVRRELEQRMQRNNPGWQAGA